MNPASEDIREILEAESILGLIFGTNLFVGHEPARPLDTVTVLDIPGYAPELALDGNAGLYRPCVQIRVRNKTYLDAYSQSFSIFEFLHGLNHITTTDGTVYESIVCVDDPYELDGGDSRFRFIFNVNIMRRSTE
jgi:hypothetical protein